MKKYIYELLLVAVVSIFFGSCKNEVDDVFDLSATERMNKAIADCQQTLISSAHGWRVDYITESGVNISLLLKFDKNNVDMYLNTEKASVSTYQITNQESILLNFDSYSVLHEYIDPSLGNPKGSGQGADVEFTVREVSADSIVCTGRKYGDKFVLKKAIEGEKTRIRLDRMLDLELGVSVSYFHGLKSADNSIVDFFLGADKKSFDFVTSTGALQNVPYENTLNGFKLSSPVTVGSTSVSEFIWDDAENTFIADGNVKLIETNQLQFPLSKSYDKFFATKYFEVLGGGVMLDSYANFKTTYPGFAGVELYINATCEIDTVVYDHVDGNLAEVGRIKAERTLSAICFKVKDFGEWIEWTNFLYKHENVTKLSDDSFKALETTREGPLKNIINRNSSVQNIKGVFFDKKGTTILDKGNGVYHLVSMSSSKKWLILKQKELQYPQMLILKENKSN